MRLRRSIPVVALALAAACGSRGPYASYSVDRSQGLPGYPGFTMEPPGSVKVSVTPRQAIGVAAPKAPASNVIVTLARVPSSFVTQPAAGSTTPVWVVLVRDSCFASSKGELVSGSRQAAAGNRPPSCTKENIWAAMVSVDHASIVGGIPGYDVTGSWRPATG
jgi:hypothetical protein